MHATDYWLRFEWQHRGSPHVHGLAWLQSAPDIEGAFTSGPVTPEIKQKFITYIDSIVCTMNPAILPDGSDASQAPAAQTNPHVCNKAFADVVDYDLDLSQLIATCQRHTICSPAYCLRTKKGQQSCRFGYPKELQRQP